MSSDEAGDALARRETREHGPMFGNRAIRLRQGSGETVAKSGSGRRQAQPVSCVRNAWTSPSRAWAQIWSGSCRHRRTSTARGGDRAPPWTALRWFGLRFGCAFPRRFGGCRLAGRLDHHQPRCEHTATVFVEIDHGVVLVDFDERTRTVGGLRNAIAFGPRFHQRYQRGSRRPPPPPRLPPNPPPPPENSGFGRASLTVRLRPPIGC